MAAVAAGVVFFPGAGTLPCICRPTVGGRPRRWLPAAAAKPFRNGSPPETDCPVPPEQQPVNEYRALAASLPFSWAAADLPHFGARLLLLGGSFALFLGLPVAWFGVVDPDRDPLKSAVAAAAAGVLADTFVVLRIYLGWAYVGNRLLSATVECKLRAKLPSTTENSPKDSIFFAKNRFFFSVVCDRLIDVFVGLQMKKRVGMMVRYYY